MRAAASASMDLPSANTSAAAVIDIDAQSTLLPRSPDPPLLDDEADAEEAEGGCLSGVVSAMLRYRWVFWLGVWYLSSTMYTVQLPQLWTQLQVAQPAVDSGESARTAWWVELGVLLLLAQFGQAAACILCQVADEAYVKLRDGEEEGGTSATSKGGAAPSGWWQQCRAQFSGEPAVLATLSAMNGLLQNTGLLFAPVAIFQAIRSVEPVFSASAAFVLDGRRISRLSTAGLGCVAVAAVWSFVSARYFAMALPASAAAAAAATNRYVAYGIACSLLMNVSNATRNLLFNKRARQPAPTQYMAAEDGTNGSNGAHASPTHAAKPSAHSTSLAFYIPPLVVSAAVTLALLPLPSTRSSILWVLSSRLYWEGCLWFGVHVYSSLAVCACIDAVLHSALGILKSPVIILGAEAIASKRLNWRAVATLSLTGAGLCWFVEGKREKGQAEEAEVERGDATRCAQLTRRRPMWLSFVLLLIFALVVVRTTISGRAAPSQPFDLTRFVVPPPPFPTAPVPPEQLWTEASPFVPLPELQCDESGAESDLDAEETGVCVDGRVEHAPHAVRECSWCRAPLLLDSELPPLSPPVRMKDPRHDPFDADEFAAMHAQAHHERQWNASVEYAQDEHFGLLAFLAPPSPVGDNQLLLHLMHAKQLPTVLDNPLYLESIPPMMRHGNYSVLLLGMRSQDSWGEQWRDGGSQHYFDLARFLGDWIRNTYYPRYLRYPTLHGAGTSAGGRGVLYLSHVLPMASLHIFGPALNKAPDEWHNFRSTLPRALFDEFSLDPARAMWWAADYCQPRESDLDAATRDLSHCPLQGQAAHEKWLLAHRDAPPTGDFFPVPPLYIVQNEWDEIHKERPFAIDSYVPRTRAAGAALGGALWAETPPELHVVRHDMVYIDPVREKEAWLSALRETVWQWHRYPYPALFEHYRNFTVAVRGPQFGAQDVIRPNSKRPDKLNGWLQAEAARLQAEPFDSLSPELKERLFFVQLFQAELSSSSWWSGNWWRHLRRTLAMPVNGQHEITLATFDAAMLWRRQLAKHRTAILAARTAQRPVRLWTYDHAQLSSPGIERYAQVARCGHQTFIQRQLMYNTEGFVLDFAQLLATSPDAASLSNMTTLAVESDVEGDNATESVGESGGYGDDEANGAYGGDAASGMGGLHGWESAAHPALADYFLLPNRFSCFLFFTRYQRDTPEANMSDLYAELTDGYLRPLLVQAAYSLPYFRRSAGSDHLSLWQHGKNMGALPADLHRLMEPTRQLCFTGLHAEPNTGTYTAAMSKYEHRGVLPTYRSGWDVLLPPFTASQDVAFDTADAEPPAFANRSTALFFAGELSHFIDGDDSARPRLAKLSASIDSDAAVQWSGQRLRALRVLNGHTPDYAQYVATSVLLLCPEGLSPWSPRIYDGVFLGAVPLLMADGMELPFERVLHTNEFVARLPVQDIGELMQWLGAADNGSLSIKKRFEVTAEARSAARAAYRWPHSMQLLDAAERQQYLADELSTHPTSLYSALAQEMRCRRLEQLHGWLSPHVSTEQAQQARYEVCRKFGDVCPCPADWLHPAADGEGVRSLPGDAAAEEAAAIPAEVVVNNASAFVLPPMWAPAEVCESSPDLPDGWSVVHVWCLTRHGHRAPVNRLPGESDASFQALFPACTTAAIYGDDAPAEHSNGTLSPNAHSKACDRMELTALGEQQEFDVGRAVRQMLLDTPDGPVRRLLLGGGTGNGSEVTFQATDTSRTKLSLLRLAQGLFPDMLPTDFKRRLTVVGRESNYLVTPYHGSAWKCERVKQLWGEAWKGERWQQKLEAVGAAKLRNDIQAELQAAFNPKGGKPSLPGDWLTLADLFKPRLAIGAGIPANLQPRMVQAADELAAMQLWIESGGERLSSGELVTEEAEVARTHELRQLNTGQMLFDVMQRIEQHVNYSTAATSPPEEERPPLLSLQCAHDFTIGALLASLQLPDSRPEHYPAYASQVCVELVARGDRPLDVDDFLVRVRYQQRVQQCQSLRSFQQRMKSLAWPTTEREQRCAAH